MRIGFAGLIHGHVWGLIDRFSEVPEMQLAAVADKTPLLDKAKERFAKSYQDWREMLDREKLDGLVVTSDNRESAEIAVQALGRGIPCLVEKAMAADAADAKRMLDAKKKSGKTLMINWPIAWSGWPHELARRISSDELGHIFHFRYRTGHWGPKEIGCDQYFVEWLYDERRNGGGAIADFCGYGAALARWYFGMPESVYAIRDNYTKADGEVPDDHAVCLLKYPNMNAVIEGTWATFGFDDGPSPLVHGKSGTIGVYGNTLKTFLPGKDAVAADAPAPPQKNPAAYFLDCIKNGKEPEGILSPVVSGDAARIVDAAVRSARSGCTEAP
jgi:predicted dehydrogenase